MAKRYNIPRSVWGYVRREVSRLAPRDDKNQPRKVLSNAQMAYLTRTVAYKMGVKKKPPEPFPTMSAITLAMLHDLADWIVTREGKPPVLYA